MPDPAAGTPAVRLLYAGDRLPRGTVPSQRVEEQTMNERHEAFGYDAMRAWITMGQAWVTQCAKLRMYSQALPFQYAQVDQITEMAQALATAGMRIADSSTKVYAAWLGLTVGQIEAMLEAASQAWSSADEQDNRPRSAGRQPDQVDADRGPCPGGEPTKAFVYTNSRGRPYYLHERSITLRGSNRQQRIYFFALRPQDGGIDRIPAGMQVSEIAGSGMPVLKKALAS
jgi:hypothetical protein